MKTTRKITTAERDKRDLQKEIERLESIPDHTVMVELLPYVKSYLKSRKDKLRTYEDSNA